MLCNLCDKNQASVHLTEIVDNQMSELHLCDDCAKKKSMQMEQQFGLSDLLAGLVDYGKQISTVEKGTIPASLECPQCGLNYEDFRKIGRLGCSECYNSFAKHLGPLLKRIHGSSQHLGKAPVNASSIKPPPQKSKIMEIADLKIQLQQAVEKEEFEEAARLRDEIKEAESSAAEDNAKDSNDKKKKGNNKKDEA